MKVYRLYRMNQTPCSVCKEAGHHARRCPELSQPLNPGFFAPSGGGQHSHDDDDEKLKLERLWQNFRTQWRILASLSPSKKL